MLQQDQLRLEGGGSDATQGYSHRVKGSRWPRSILLSACGLAFLGVECPLEPRDDAQYDILLIVADDLSFDHYGFAGHPVLQTPSLDALAARSLRYPHAYVSSSCRPTLATLLTGLPEHRHGVTYLAGPQLRSRFATLADRLVDVGYSTYQAGKFWENDPSRLGFTDFAPFTGRNGNGLIGRTPIKPVFDFTGGTGGPWFVWFSPKMPHAPHTAPDQYRRLYEGLDLNPATVEYFAMISWFDAVVGELLRGVDDDTVVIFLADNGYVQSTSPEIREPRSKHSSYEHGIRTQLLIRHPRHEPASRWQLANAVDVTATILSIAGAHRSDLPGRDLLGGHPFHFSAFGSRSTTGLVDEPGVQLERWVRLGDWKLVDVDDGEDRMHYLGSDPEEFDNLIEAPAAHPLRFVLRSRLERWWEL